MRGSAVLGTWGCLIILTFALGFCEPETAYSQSQKVIEYRFKAVYLFNFLQFVEWPATAFDHEQAPIVLGVLGDDPFGGILDETVQSEKVGDHPIVVRRFRSMDEIGHCHALFVCSSDSDILGRILRQIGESSVLTVSDIEGFGDLGGGIGFYLEKNKVRFEINMQALKRADLKVSSKLLRLARIINPS